MNPSQKSDFWVRATRLRSRTSDHETRAALSLSAPWENPTAASDKFQWVKKHLGQAAYQRLILTHHKTPTAG